MALPLLGRAHKPPRPHHVVPVRSGQLPTQQILRYSFASALNDRGFRPLIRFRPSSPARLHQPARGFIRLSFRATGEESLDSLLAPASTRALGFTHPLPPSGEGGGVP